jgi:hypothetical protein
MPGEELMAAVTSHARVVLADDHDAVRGLLKEVLEQQGYVIVGEAGGVWRLSWSANVPRRLSWYLIC